MGRPKSNVLLFKIISPTLTLEIIEADNIYAVLYKGKPINARTSQTHLDYPGPKYKRIAFAMPGHAFNLAERLNNLFKTTDFTVFVMEKGKQAYEN